MKLIELEKDKYESFVKTNKYKSHFLQSSSWGELCKEKRGLKPYFLGLVEKDKVLAATLLLKKSLPLGLCYLYSPIGFVLDFNDFKILDKFTEEIVKFAKKEKAIYLKIDPDIIWKKENYLGEVTLEEAKEQKIFKELKRLGKTVSMVGDGVNDVLALKESDCSIALACGSEAAYNVSDLVLLDSDFTSIPSIVEEGRRTINNIEKSASLFIVKTGYAIMLALIFMLIPYNYPFIPVQLTLTNALTIGIPSFILALEPNKKKVTGNFLTNVFRKAIPTSFIIVLSIMIITFLPLDFIEKSTLSLITVGLVGFIHIYRVCYPPKKYHLFMISILLTLFIIGITLFKKLFSVTTINILMLLTIVLLIGVAIIILKAIDIYKTKIR